MITENRPLISIITPSYNQGRFIEKTILSVLNQKDSDFEYIVMDGGSNDNTLEILKKYEGRLKWFSEKDKGQAHAINKGWKIARGEIFAWLNSDDTYEPMAFRKAAEFLAQNRDCDLVYGEGHHITENDQFIEKYPTEPFNFERLKKVCFICQPTVFLRRDVIEKIGYLNENLQFCMDYEFWIRAAKARLNFCYMSGERLANTRFYPDTKTSGQRVKVHKEILYMAHEQLSVMPMEWIYAYLHIKLEKYNHKENKFLRSFFVISLSVLSMLFSLRYNKKVPAGEIRRWVGWIKGLFN